MMGCMIATSTKDRHSSYCSVAREVILILKDTMDQPDMPTTERNTYFIITDNHNNHICPIIAHPGIS